MLVYLVYLIYPRLADLTVQTYTFVVHDAFHLRELGQVVALVETCRERLHRHRPPLASGVLVPLLVGREEVSGANVPWN